MRLIWIFLIILFVFVYFVSPIDFIPEALFGLFGKIDDFSLLGLLIWFLSKQIITRKQNYRKNYQQDRSYGFNDRQNNESRNQYNRNSSKKGNNGHYEQKEKYKRGKQSNETNDPYVILNVSRYATKDEIKKAYKELIKKYHPDKVAYLGEEFQKMAHKKMVNIQKAYEVLMNK